MFVRLIYASRATNTMSDDDLLAILDVSRRNNEKANVTGMLVFAEGDFLQVLEGDPKTIAALYERIEDDERHQNCRIFDRSEVSERIFSEWNMGFRQLSKQELTNTPGFVDFFHPEMTPKALQSPTSSAQFLLLGFRDLNQQLAN